MVTDFGLSQRNWFTPPSFNAVAFQNGLKDHNKEVERLNGDDPRTSGRNLASFRLVTSEFTRLDCVQQSSISTRVCFSTIRKGATLLGWTRLCMHFLVTES